MLPDLGAQPFIVVHADTIVLEPLHAFVSEYQRRGCPQLMLMVSTAPEMTDYGRVGLAGKRVARLRQSRAPTVHEEQRAAFSGVRIVSPHLWNSFTPGVPAADFISEIAIPWLVAGNPIYAHIMSHPFFDIGTPERLEDVEVFFGDG